MLRQLTIHNYAIIDALVVPFPGKLCIITGETGAGKSIIVGALGLVLGDRADSSSLVNREKKCIVEAVFSGPFKKEIDRFLSSAELDREEELVLRREIGVNGKSRAFINDTPVTVSQLQQLGAQLIDLHQQFDTQAVGESDFQREVLDALAGNAELLEQYQFVFHQWQKEKKELAALEEKQQQLDREADYNRFQFEELEAAAFRENEIEDTEAELKLLSNAEGIRSALEKANYTLQESESPFVPQLKILFNQLSVFSGLHPGLPPLLERLQSAQIELQDIAGELEHLSGQVTSDPRKTEQLGERLSLGYKLQKKHGVTSTNALLETRDRLAAKLQAVTDMQDAIRAKESLLAGLEKDLSKRAAQLSSNRKKQLKPLETQVNKLLVQVGMPNARLKASLEPSGFSASGADTIAFLFNANLPAADKGNDSLFLPLRKVASGGELSRLMLCIKSLVAQSIDLPTLIFDEIDTGISGEAARQVGIIMKGLAARRQVICITHQPQIAGKADAHYFVYKEIDGNTVKTNIRLLSTEERITTIAKMLSGEKPTAAAMENAREMLMN